jgi:hypothetical protein
MFYTKQLVGGCDGLNMRSSNFGMKKDFTPKEKEGE